MKKVLGLLLVFLMVSTLVGGCSQANIDELNEHGEVFLDGEKIDWANMIPDPYDVFEDPKVIYQYSNESGYGILVKNISNKEFKVYVEKCKEKGFDDVEVETYDEEMTGYDDLFSWYLGNDLKNEYQISVQDHPSSEGVFIDICKRKEK